MSLTITSSAFQHGEAIPAQCTCDGGDRSPPLAWSGSPPRTQSFALVVDDPDAPDPAAPKTTWVHWVLYNLPSDCVGLTEGVQTLPPGTREGRNDWRRTGYGGPCPPVGRHRYFHKLYALDTELPDMHLPTKAQLMRAIQGHVLAEAVLVGTYQRAR